MLLLLQRSRGKGLARGEGKDGPMKLITSEHVVCGACLVSYEGVPGRGVQMHSKLVLGLSSEDVGPPLTLARVL